jgi:hypothetical protein
MSDFLAPILHVMEDESESFWCFASLMERLGGNFNRDQNGMHAQLLGLSKVRMDYPFTIRSAELLSIYWSSFVGVVLLAYQVRMKTTLL